MKSTIIVVMMIFSFLSGISSKNSFTYSVKRLKKNIKIVKIDSNWNKPQWHSAKVIEITNYIGQILPSRPTFYAKMMYNEDNLYVIFQVNDCYVHSILDKYNVPVSTDTCVEFFFSPDTSLPERYCNLEINAGGTPLMAYHIFQQKDYQKHSVEGLKKIEIVHSLPKKADPKIGTPIIWTINEIGKII